MGRGGKRPGAGRKRKPDYLKLLDGNPGHRPIAENDPAGDENDVPVTDIVCPAWLDTPARRVWRSLQPVLYDAGALKNTDADALGLLCSAYSQWKDATKRLSEADAIAIGIVETIKKAEPHQAAQIEEMLKAFCQHEESRQQKKEDKFYNRMRWLMTEFGMTPAARAKLKSEPGSPGKGDDLDAFLKGNKK